MIFLGGSIFPIWRSILSEASPLQPRVRGVDRSRETGPALEVALSFSRLVGPDRGAFPTQSEVSAGRPDSDIGIGRSGASD